MTFKQWYMDQFGITLEEAQGIPGWSIAQQAWSVAHNLGYQKGRKEGGERAADYGYGGTRRHALDMD